MMHQDNHLYFAFLWSQRPQFSLFCTPAMTELQVFSYFLITTRKVLSGRAHAHPKVNYQSLPKRWPREGWQPTYRQTAKTQLWVLTALCNLFSPECQLAWCFAVNQQVMMRWYHPSIRLPNTVTFLHSHILYCPLGLLQAVLRIYLFERKSYKDTWRDGERSSSCWLTPWIAVMAKAGLGRSQEFQFECLTHAQRPKPLGHVLCLIIP